MSLYYINNNKRETISLDEIKLFAKENKFIALVKNYRNVSGLGLKESKDAMDECYRQDSNGHRLYDMSKLLRTFKQHLTPVEPPAVTKEEFMHLIEDSIDNMETFHFTDMLEAVTLLCSNINKNGGLTNIAEKREEFLESI